MTDIDDALARMAAEPVPAGLEAIDGRVLARIASGPEPVGPGIGLLAVAIAGGLGVLGAGMGAGPVQAAAPFGMAGAPTPSMLLR